MQQPSATSQNEVHKKFFPKRTKFFKIQFQKAEILRVIGRVKQSDNWLPNQLFAVKGQPYIFLKNKKKDELKLEFF